MLNAWEFACWAIGMLLLLLLLGILLLGRRYRRYPWFTVLIAQYGAQSLVLGLLHLYAGHRAYFFAYWSGVIVATAVRFGVLFELARAIKPCLPWSTFRTTGVVSVGLWFLLSGMFVESTSYHALNLLVRCSLEFGFLASVMTFMLAFEITFVPWLYGVRLGGHAPAICYGLVVFFGSSTLSDVTLMLGGTDSWKFCEQALKPLYLLCLAAWCIHLRKPEPERRDLGIFRVLRPALAGQTIQDFGTGERRRTIRTKAQRIL